MTFSFQALLDHWRTFVVIVVQSLAMQALEAFVRIDVAFRMYGLNHAFTGTTLTGITAFAIATQPFVHP